MKKALVLLVALLSMTATNAQFKTEGVKTILEVGAGVSNYKVSDNIDGLTLSISGFGYISPQVDFSVGGMINQSLFLGAGVGYDAIIGVENFEGTSHEAKVFAHLRSYFGDNSRFFIDLKAGYKRNFTDECGGFDMFVGPGIFLGDKLTLSAGYIGTFYEYKQKLNGGALKLGFEF